MDLRRGELYLDARGLHSLTRELHLEPTGKAGANVIVHVPATSSWPFQEDESGTVTVALDLFDSGEPRSQRAARALWKHELAKRRFDRHAR